MFSLHPTLTLLSLSISSKGVPEGNLPKWLLLVSFLATFNCVQNYIDHSFARKVYTHGLAQGECLHRHLPSLKTSFIRSFDTQKKRLFNHPLFYSHESSSFTFLLLVTPLSSRTFGIWNLTSAIIRAYCAYNMNNKPLYEICMLTYVIALTHFISEVVVYKTARLTPGIISPLIVACELGFWLSGQRTTSRKRKMDRLFFLPFACSRFFSCSTDVEKYLTFRRRRVSKLEVIYP